MNHSRVLRATNIVLLLSGYQIHWLDSKTQRFRLSLTGVVYILALGCIYAACFAQHLDASSSMLTILKNVSSFLFGLTRLQLFMGVNVFVYAVYSSVRAVGVINPLMESLAGKGEWIPERRGHGVCSLDLYFWDTPLLWLLHCLRNEFRAASPSRRHDWNGYLYTTSLSCRIPEIVQHFGLANAWKLKEIQTNVEEALGDSLKKDEVEISSTSFTVSVSNSSLESLESLHKQLVLLGTRFGRFFKAMQHSLLFLVTMNGNCLLVGIYSYVYYRNFWHVLFEDRKRRIFYAANASIYACIASDYVCLLLVQFFMEREVRSAAENVLWKS
ncbi:GL25665 [Drosophila persimilis]|uniref:GL25665 n=1 Tax=Drosophila persimilis TaxID=7234 RepID=B4GKM0_DROPE|nr:GL25665 [Drosophila persimilis]